MSLRHALLGLLVDRRASGYDLMKLFDTSLANVWPATQSQVYGELGRLAADGLLEVGDEGPRGRKDYTLSDAGMVELRRWLTETRPEQQRRSDTLLRVFFLGVLTPEQGRDYLGRQAARAAEHHAQLEQLHDSVDWEEEGMLSSYGRLTLEYGLRLTAMQEQWARWATEQLPTNQPTGAPGLSAEGME